MSQLSFVPPNPPASIALRFPAIDIDLIDFHDLTPIGVQTDLATPIAPGTRQFLEIVTPSGVIVPAAVCAIHCRPVPCMPDVWTFVVTWEFIGDDEFQTRLEALIDASGLEAPDETWH